MGSNPEAHRIAPVCADFLRKRAGTQVAQLLPDMAVRQHSLVKTARGMATVAKRRGVGYFGYLLGGVAWPRAAYRFGWGPGAPPVLQGVFAAAGELAAEKPSTAELEVHRLVAADAEP